MRAENRRRLVAGAVALSALLASAPIALAQSDDPSAASVPGEPAAPAAPPSSVATPPDGSAPALDPSAVSPDGAVPSTVPDPFAANAEPLSSGAYGGQPAFDSVPRGVNAALVRSAQQRLQAARDAYQDAQRTLEEHTADMAALEARIVANGTEREADLVAAADAKTSMRERAVEAYVRGDQSFTVWALIDNPVDYSRASRYLESLAGQDRDLAAAYLRSVRRLSAEERALADERADLGEAVVSATARLDAARVELANASFCAQAFAAGSHACADGFRFPVLGEVNFIDSFGFPRQVGNPNQHWHEGSDIMAPSGREIVAVERGTITRVGDDSGLGGLRMWLEGDSGNRYYYAHFSSYAAGITVGTVVDPGTVLGGVGNTGAPGSAPHLHFEIYPAGSDRPINPYPLLKASWGDRPMRSEAEVSSGLANMSGSLPAEER